MPIELAAHTEAGARLVAIAEELSPQLATRAAEHDRDGSYPFEAIDALKAAGYFAAPVPDRARWTRRLLRPRPGRRVKPPGPRRRLGRDRREHAPRRGAQHGTPPPSRGRGRGGAPRPRLRVLARADRRATALCWPPRSASAGRTSRGRARSRPAPHPAGGSMGARCSPRCPPPPPTSMSPSRTPTTRAPSATHTRWCPPTRLASSSTTTGTRSGCARQAATRSRSRACELPESGVRGGFRAGDPLPYMERNLVAGLFHAAASLGIAESADQIARQGIAGRINGDARPRMQVAENTIDLAASRGVISRAATLIDEHRAANPASDGSAEQLEALFAEAQAAKAFVNEAASPHRRPCARALGRRRLPQRQPARPRLPRRQGRHPSCTRSAPTAPTTTSATSRSAKRRRCTEMALAAPANPAPAPTRARSVTHSAGSPPASRSSPRRPTASPPG